MMPDLVNIARIELLHLLQQPDRGEVARARPHGEILRRHGFEIVVEHIGPRRDHDLGRADPCAGSPASALRSWSSASRRGSRGSPAAKCARAAVVEIVAIDRRDDDVARARASRPPRRHASARRGSSAPGSPVFTLQNAQARVHVSPMIMKVACFFSQHSPMLGQPASSHTVCRPFSLTMRCVSA